jgi:putative phosphotransacetylase
MKVTIEASARHVHLCQKDLEKLFGKNYQLKPLKKLSQALDFAAREVVVLKNGKNMISNVRIVGPVRRVSQVEITYTEARKLGVKGVLRVSGNIKNTPGIQLIGPKGKVQLKEGVMVAQRHLHVPEKLAQKLGLRQNQKVQVQVKGKRALIFNEVTVRISPNFKWRLHLDTDEANAASIGLDEKSNIGEVII